MHLAPRHARRSRLPRAAAAPAALALVLGGALTGLSLTDGTASAGSAPLEQAAPEQVSAEQLLAARAVPARASRDRAPEDVAPAAARPGDGRLTSPFGPRWGRAHSGIDLAAGVGAPVRAAAAGTVATAGVEGAYGTTVRVHHADDTETVYAHLSTADVLPGTPVEAGQPLGREGSTGRSTGPHLHFEVRIAGTPVDPVPWLAARGVVVG